MKVGRPRNKARRDLPTPPQPYLVDTAQTNLDHIDTNQHTTLDHLVGLCPPSSSPILLLPPHPSFPLASPSPLPLLPPHPSFSLIPPYTLSHLPSFLSLPTSFPLVSPSPSSYFPLPPPLTIPESLITGRCLNPMVRKRLNTCGRGAWWDIV